MMVVVRPVPVVISLSPSNARLLEQQIDFLIEQANGTPAQQSPRVRVLKSIKRQIIKELA